MSWTVDWIDEDLHVYDSSIRDPFPPEEIDGFYQAWFGLVESGPAPLYALFDVSEWHGSSASLLDARFLRMGQYRAKIRVIAMVSGRSRFLEATAKVGATMLGRRDWFKFFDSREAAIAYLMERARAEQSEWKSPEAPADDGRDTD